MQFLGLFLIITSGLCFVFSLLAAKWFSAIICAMLFIIGKKIKGNNIASDRNKLREFNRQFQEQQHREFVDQMDRDHQKLQHQQWNNH